MNDYISRQAAIDAVNGLPDCPNGFSGTYDKAAIIGILEDVPSAQPEIIHCGDCKYKDDGIDEDGIPFLKCLNGRSYGGTRINDYCSWAERGQEADSSGNMSGTHKNSNSTETHDLVDRQAAIDALRNRWLKTKNYEGIGEDIAEECEIYLRTVPSAQPERMTNRQWVDFLSAQFDISRTSAKEMLHGMMRWKKEDNFKKMFNGGKT